MALAAAALLMASVGWAAESTPAEELQAAKILTAVLDARGAKAEEWAKMRGIYADLVKKYPKDATMRDAQGEFLWGQNDPMGAIAAWKAGEKLDPKNGSILLNLGTASLSRGETKEALAYDLRASAANPDSAVTHFHIANLAFLFRHDLERPEAEAFALALEHYDAAHHLAPLNADYARAYAETYYVVPNPDWGNALKIWQAYLELAADKSFARLNVARVHLKLGQVEEARGVLAQVEGAAYQRQKKSLLAQLEGLSAKAAAGEER